MRVRKLTLEKMGPFDEAHLEFVADGDAPPGPIALLTGENGTGKTILIDAIRAMFGQRDATIERAFWRGAVSFSIRVRFSHDGKKGTASSTQTYGDSLFQMAEEGPAVELEDFPRLVEIRNAPRNFIVDYWRTTQATDTFDVPSVAKFEPREYLSNALSGVHRNADVTGSIVFFDYLRTSGDERERLAGQALVGLLEKIVAMSLLDGRTFSHVEPARI